MLYLDTSFLVPLILPEATSVRIERFVNRQPAGELAISRWTEIEFSSVIAREVRMGALDRQAALKADAALDALSARSFIVLLPAAADFDVARAYLQRHDTGLRAGDALHLAIASNHRATQICSLDKGMLTAGRVLALPVTTGIRMAGS